MTRRLRDYQAEAVAAVQDGWGRGLLRPAVVMATGLGKTDVIAHLATTEAAAGGRVLCLAHRSELLDQIRDRCRMHRPDIAVGRVQAGTDQRGYPITVAMTPTLARESRRARMPRPSLVIYDECHHAPSASSMAILEWAGCWDATRAVGVTATLTRGDRRGPGMVWQEAVYERDIRWAVEHGWLVRPRGRVVVADHLDLNAAKISRGDFQDDELGEMVAQDTDQIVRAWLQHAADRLTVAFTPNVASAEALRDEFERAGIKAEAVYGATSRSERDAIYGRLAAGVTRVLVGVMVTTEGWDCPPVSCVLMARPTRLAGLYAQMVGRGLRLSPDTGKTDCLVLDVVGTSRAVRGLASLVDLSPGAEYDTSEQDEQPCDDCGLYPCECVREPVERDPNGGRRRLVGPADYEEVDLLLADSPWRWLQTRAGRPFLPVGDRMAVLWPDTRDPRAATGWEVGTMAIRGPEDPRPLATGRHGLDEAQRVGEEWASSTGAAPRRPSRARPTEVQLGKAAALGIRAPERFNRGELDDQMAIARASLRLDR